MKFTEIELDLIVRGLFALQQLNPQDVNIQGLLNKLANTVYVVEEAKNGQT